MKSKPPVPETSIDTIQQNLESDLRFRKRRHDPWTTNYSLYRDHVIPNRLTQRQSVNVPLMKATIRTLLSRSREMTDLDFEDYNNNGLPQLLINACWEKATKETSTNSSAWWIRTRTHRCETHR